MWRHDNNIEHHGDCAKELLKRGRIWGLKKVQEEVDGLLCALSTVTPTLLQTQFLEPIFVKLEDVKSQE